MRDRAELDYIDKLHHIGRQLAVLKRIYQSYVHIIDQALEGQKARNHSIGGDVNWPSSCTPNWEGPGRTHMLGRNPSDERPGLLSPPAPVPRRDSMGSFRLVLAQPAILRFERLRDRIKLYALSEIQDCLDEKESLAFMVGAVHCE